jgi:hypothetical protein
MTKASSIPRFQPPSEAAHIRQPKPDDDDWRDKSLFKPRGEVVCGYCQKPVCECKGEVKEAK